MLEPVLVSVVIPTYDGAAHAAETLRSVRAQTHPLIEIIVVDDGSMDDTVATVQVVAPQARIVQQSNAGVSSARNTGLRAARGQVVCFLDQDDVWHPLHLAEQLRCLAEAPEAGVVVSPYQHWHADAQGHHKPAVECWPAEPQTPGAPIDPDFSGWVYHQFMLDCWALTSATMLRRHVVLDAGGFDETLPFSEDWDLWLRLSRQVPFVKLTGPPVLYRQHAVQGSRRARPVDHRCRLLLASAAAHGLASRDGRAIDPLRFGRNIARYQADFGYHHLQHGDARLGARSLWQAWRRDPTEARTLALALAGSLGWRPARSAGSATPITPE